MLKRIALITYGSVAAVLVLGLSLCARPRRRSKTSSADASRVVANAIKAKFLLLMLVPGMVVLEAFGR